MDLELFVLFWLLLEFCFVGVWVCLLLFVITRAAFSHCSSSFQLILRSLPGQGTGERTNNVPMRITAFQWRMDMHWYEQCQKSGVTWSTDLSPSPEPVTGWLCCILGDGPGNVNSVFEGQATGLSDPWAPLALTVLCGSQCWWSREEKVRDLGNQVTFLSSS